MECYRTKDNTVAKYVHDDGSETAIKTTPYEKFGGDYGKVINKFNVFISHSVGCPVGCKFCYLTVKKCPYHKLTASQIFNNVIKAIKAEVKARPELHYMYCKLSWMGMGDPCIDGKLTFDATADIVNYLLKYNICKGIDGIDIATTLPKNFKNIDFINDLYVIVDLDELNPERNYNTTEEAVRFFYSLHSAVDSTRSNLIPNSLSLHTAEDMLLDLIPRVFIHHMLFEDVNTSKEELDAIIAFMGKINSELRLLRFNSCDGTSFTEAKDFDELVEYLYSRYSNIKVQSSPGSEVKAACGQFLLSKIR